MAAASGGARGRRRRHLTPQEKHQVWCETIDGQGTPREIADKWGIGRCTVVHIIELAKEGPLERVAASNPGRPGKSVRDAELEDAGAAIARLQWSALLVSAHHPASRWRA